MTEFTLFSGSADLDLSERLARCLDHRISHSKFERFPDGELSVCLEEPVRGHPIFVVQPLSPPGTENLFELLLFVDACRRAAAGRITAVVPYLGYTRSDKRHGRREAIAASLVAKMLVSAGLDHLLTLDLHSPQITGFYQIPMDTLTAVPTLCDAIKHHIPANVIVVTPDEGRLKMAREYAQRLDAQVAIIYKQRKTGRETHAIAVLGDVRDRPCLIIDDMISTGGTLATAIEALLDAGARPEITIAATHGVLLPESKSRLRQEAVKKIFVTDSVRPHHADWPELKVVTIVPLLAAAIQRLANCESIGDLYL